MAAASHNPDSSGDLLGMLFNAGLTNKQNVWEIDLLKILDSIGRILERSDTLDLRVAGIAAHHSALIYRAKVENIFTMQKDMMKKSAPRRRTPMGIQTISMPYRHQSTYAVSLEDLLELLQNLVVSIANPHSRRGRLNLEPVPVPDIREHLISIESVITEYKDLILKKIQHTGRGSLQSMVEDLDTLDSIRCFFAALFLARDGRISLEQDGEDIIIMADTGEASHTEAADVQDPS